MLLFWRHFSNGFFIPIRSRIVHRIGTCTIFFKLFRCVFWRLAGIHQCFITIICILISIHHLQVFNRILQTYCIAIVDFGFTDITFLCFNNDDTICTFKTINGCRGIFQYIDRFYFVWIYLRERSFHTVHNGQSIPETTNVECTSIVTRLTVSLLETDTRNLT